VMDLETKEEKGIIETEPGESISQTYRLGKKWFFHSAEQDNNESDDSRTEQDNNESYEVGTEDGKWWSLDMANGEKKQIKTEDLESSISPFVPVGDLLYATPYSPHLAGKLVAYDEEKDETKLVDIIDKNEIKPSKDGVTYERPVDVGALITDGRYLYTLAGGLKVLEVKEDGVQVIWSQS